MDENELNPTGLAGSADEDLKIIEDYLAGEQEDEEQDQGLVEQPIEQSIPQDQDPLIVDTQDLRNHPRFEELNLDIPYKEDEGKPGYYEKYPEIYGNYSKLEAARIWMERKHALTKEGYPELEVASAIKKGGLKLISSVLTARERYVDMTTGQMSRVDGQMIDTRTGKPYKPDWDPLGNVKDPWTNSWWGKLTEGVVHYGIGTR